MYIRLGFGEVPKFSKCQHESKRPKADVKFSFDIHVDSMLLTRTSNDNLYYSALKPSWQLFNRKT